MTRFIEHGIEWQYQRGVVYVASYGGYRLTIRRIPAARWRLSVVHATGGASLAFKHQMWTNAPAARVEAKRLVDQGKK